MFLNVIKNGDFNDIPNDKIDRILQEFPRL